MELDKIFAEEPVWSEQKSVPQRRMRMNQLKIGVADNLIPLESKILLISPVQVEFRAILLDFSSKRYP